MTATFTFSPAYGSPKNSAPRMLSAIFGDGYQQDLVDGINADLKSWDLTFTNRSSADADAIEAFLSLNLGQAFNWTPPGFPTSTTATAEPFGTGDGSTLLFLLKKNGVAVRNITASPLIYRSDWQGNQLLYATARTNLVKQSADFSNAAWTKTRLTATGASGTSPDGTNTLTKLTEDATASASRFVSSTAFTATAQPYTGTAYFKAGTRTFGWISLDGSAAVWFNLTTGAVGTASGGCSGTITLMPNGVYKCTITQTQTAGSKNMLVGPASVDGSYIYTGDGASYLYGWGGGVEAGSVATSYIPTTTTAVTVTDYTVNLTTGLVTLAVAPLSAAALTWTGSFTPTYLWKCAIWKRTPVDYGTDTVTATFKQVLG